MRKTLLVKHGWEFFERDGILDWREADGLSASGTQPSETKFFDGGPCQRAGCDCGGSGNPCGQPEEADSYLLEDGRTLRLFFRWNGGINSGQMEFTRAQIY